jgi:pSer/pThr/pTyr-binding forkhead associated (FHA) protein
VPRWIRSLTQITRTRPAPESRRAVVELLVLEGHDAGQRFTVDGDEVMIGRRPSAANLDRGVMLKDPTVSAQQAIIRREGDGLVIEHIPEATNPTRLDGRAVTKEKLEVGCRIEIGHVVIDVRESTGIALSQLTQLGTAVVPDLGGITEVTDTSLANAETTEIRQVTSQVGTLVLEQGSELASAKEFPIYSSGTTLGRGRDCDVQLADRGISRKHAELMSHNGKLTIWHLSNVNPTLLNDCEVVDHETVNDGDKIQLADRVVIRVETGRRVDTAGADHEDDHHRRSLRQRLEEKLEIDRRIEQEYTVDGSFLDVDVVNSYGMKAQAARADHIVVSFERFRSYVAAVVVEYGGHVLNSNGDELMCYFESTLDSVRAGSQILQRLGLFNAEENLLSVPFQFRVGVHSGRCLVDLDQGVAYSPVLDVAGHLQKLADINGLMVSESAFDVLDASLPFEHAGTMEREGLVYYRLTGSLS